MGWRAHPRSRGENLRRLRGVWVSDGSSPLTRGKRGRGGDVAGPGGLIPAHAGKTSWFRLVRLGASAHPRSRGENPSLSQQTSQQPGSSPLTRGKPTARILQAYAPRLIPAHAGKTNENTVSGREDGAHPRSRGENLLGSSKNMLYTGSSPLTRGKRRRGRSRLSVFRLIPAHAGKTGLNRVNVTRSRAHPRSRGENAVAVVSGFSPVGSSPLTRGKRQQLDQGGRVTGLIPAHAGKTITRCPCKARAAAHPRSRGEN